MTERNILGCLRLINIRILCKNYNIFDATTVFAVEKLKKKALTLSGRGYNIILYYYI